MGVAAETEKVRDIFVQRLRGQLFGPIGGEREELEEFDEPHRRYTVGILYPRDASSVGGMIDEADEVGVSVSDPDDPDDSPLATFLQRAPASAGMTFAVSGNAKIQLKLCAAIYELGEHEAADDEIVSKYRRAPLEGVVEYTINKKKVDVYKEPVFGGRGLLHLRSRAIGNLHLITVALINSKVVEENSYINSEDSLYQVQMTAKCISGNFSEPPTPRAAFDKEEEELRLRYRNKIAWGNGHGTSVRWKMDEKNQRPAEVAIDFMPESDVLQFVTGDSDEKVLSIDFLSKCDDVEELRKKLIVFVDEFKSWRERFNDWNCGLEHKDALSRLLKNLQGQEDRLHFGIKVLCDPEHPERIQAFKIANLAMLDQMKQASIKINKDFKREMASWFPFQLAFQLLSLPGIINEGEESGRELVDLIWFPTGGGKTEAYLLLAAFTIIWRRLVHGEKGAGTAVISRYTLRLLTSQQFDRTSVLICALERLRKQEVIPGEKKITIGLWAGESVSPNTIRNAIFKYDEMIDDARPTSEAFKIIDCPWCGHDLVPKVKSDEPSDYGVYAEPAGVTFNCVDPSCEFHKELPIQVVDECLYDQPPAILLGTIDKFARVPWMHKSRSFFGFEQKVRPPDLIIQDELHLISGPLGTIAAIYECGIDILSFNKEEGSSAKIIASTATIRGAKEQTSRLYGREVKIFPSPGPDYDDSFYMTLDKSDNPQSRKYLGIMGQGNSPLTSNVHVSAALLDTAQHVTDTDLFWTLVSFHNSKRELGKTLTLCRDDVKVRMEQIHLDDPSKSIPVRPCNNITELSANPGISVPEILKQMEQRRGSGDEIDVLACTNMLSVGVDVLRLNLMLILGQPKTASEYIQASSRVGRSRDSEGLVVALFSPTKPRDRSHYESFPRFHEAIYRWVEPTSVTPHSLPALERALHAVVIMLGRLFLYPQDEQASDIDVNNKEFEQLVDQLKRRLSRSVDPEQLDQINSEIDKVVSWWSNSSIEHKNLHYKQEKQYKGLMRSFGTKKRHSAKETLHSMRHVDAAAITFVADQHQPDDEDESAYIPKGRELRRSQLISVHGPGAIVDVSGESFVVCGIENWHAQGLEPCDLNRLSRRLGVDNLKQPKSDSSFDGRTLPSVQLERFPRWLFCPQCRRMKKWLIGDEQALPLGEAPKCFTCVDRVLVPMRFVNICENGHLRDIDWHRWFHSNETGGNAPVQCDENQLFFNSAGKKQRSRDWSLFIECRGCELPPKNLGDLYSSYASIGKCGKGSQPWQRHDVECEADLKIVQKGDSNLHFSNVMSAIDIPLQDCGTADVELRDRVMDDLEQLQTLYEDGHLNQTQVGRNLQKYSTIHDIPLELIESVFYRQETDIDVDDSIADKDLRLEFKLEEYPVLKNPSQSNYQNFMGTNYVPDASEFGEPLSTLIDGVSLLTRLREVRAFRGFHRSKPGGLDRMVAPSLKETTWLPSYEVYGEGIFIDFNFDKLKQWRSNLPRIELDRAENLRTRLEEKSIFFLPDPDPILVALHGFAHILIKQLCFDCGYASASLRERLYIGESNGMSGILIYTADGDSEGTLGGLVRQGDKDRLPAIILRALKEASWCSADPLCRESEFQGIAGLNTAACHACLLLAETSCECANALLDRRLIVGDGDGIHGLFEDVMTEGGI